MMQSSAFAPGRVELLGNHTDYNQGLVLAAAIDRGLRVSGARRSDRRIALCSNSAGEFESDLDNLRPVAEPAWVNYPLGVVRELLEAGVKIGGFSARIEGDLPSGWGLSSSAALEVATAYFLLRLFSAELSPLAVARLCQRAEHHFVGVHCGLLDQLTSICGRAGHAIFFDARNDEVRPIPFPADLVLIIAESSARRELTAGLYNRRRLETRAAAEALGVNSLRDVSPNDLARSDLPLLLRRRAAHIVGENDRVRRALKLLARSDGRGLGALMFESHESSRCNFENSTPELDLLVEIARDVPGVHGARLTGGGFGGATVTLCESDTAAQAAEAIAQRYAQRSGLTARVFVCRPANGAH
ncbi:MAG TPA: galactokinase [Chthoniobacterales bacterium]|jgi:galactokinase